MKLKLFYRVPSVVFFVQVFLHLPNDDPFEVALGALHPLHQVLLAAVQVDLFPLEANVVALRAFQGNPLVLRVHVVRHGRVVGGLESTLDTPEHFLPFGPTAFGHFGQGFDRVTPFLIQFGLVLIVQLSFSFLGGFGVALFEFVDLPLKLFNVCLDTD